MCNDYQLHVRREEYCEVLQALELGVPTQRGEFSRFVAEGTLVETIRPGRNG